MSRIGRIDGESGRSRGRDRGDFHRDGIASATFEGGWVETIGSFTRGIDVAFPRGSPLDSNHGRRGCDGHAGGLMRLRRRLLRGGDDEPLWLGNLQRHESGPLSFGAGGAGAHGSPGGAAGTGRTLARGGVGGGQATLLQG